jgi:hypothetical protein
MSKIKAPKNPHSAHCSECGAKIVSWATGKEVVPWWIQIGNKIYCKKHYERAQKEYSKRKQSADNI